MTSLTGYSQELVTNGDFESAPTGAWFGNAFNIVTQGSNNLNQANVASAGAPFDVNLSQVINLQDGLPYELSFVAFTDATTNSRTIIAGLGQNAAPFAALTETPTITATPQTFTFQFTVNYGDDLDDRVLFDLGAETGFVFIDDVSVIEVTTTCNNGVQDGDETGVDCGGSICPACPNPPTVVAPTPDELPEQVISLFSNAYTNIGIDAWSAPWDDSDIEDVVVQGDDVKKITFTNFLGVDFATQPFDASQMTHFHMDYWTNETDLVGKVLNPKWSNHLGGNGETNAFDLTNPVPMGSTGQWVSVEVPLTDFVEVNGNDKSAFAQFLLTSNLDIVYVDNIYLFNPNLSVNDFDANQFTSYPNPTNDVWNINSKNVNITKIEVFNTLGRLVKEVSVNNLNAEINASDLSSGIYFAKVTSESKSTILKLIKE